MKKTLENGRDCEARRYFWGELQGKKEMMCLKQTRIHVRESGCAVRLMWMSEEDRRFCRFSHSPFTQSYHFCPYSPPYFQNPSTSLPTRVSFTRLPTLHRVEVKHFTRLCLTAVKYADNLLLHSRKP